MQQGPRFGVYLSVLSPHKRKFTLVDEFTLERSTDTHLQRSQPRLIVNHLLGKQMILNQVRLGPIIFTEVPLYSLNNIFPVSHTYTHARAHLPRRRPYRRRHARHAPPRPRPGAPRRPPRRTPPARSARPTGRRRPGSGTRPRRTAASAGIMAMAIIMVREEARKNDEMRLHCIATECEPRRKSVHSHVVSRQRHACADERVQCH
jgi:hypothetical protein